MLKRFVASILFPTGNEQLATIFKNAFHQTKSYVKITSHAHIILCNREVVCFCKFLIHHFCWYWIYPCLIKRKKTRLTEQMFRKYTSTDNIYHSKNLYVVIYCKCLHIHEITFNIGYVR